MPSKILACTCKHPAQDEFYGEGKRVFNQTMANDKRTYRCTVCSKEKSVGGDEPKKKK